MHGVTEALGMAASLTSFVIWVPQGRRVWRGRHDPAELAGIAVSTQAISLVGNILWTLYAIGIGSFWLGAPAIVNVPVLGMGVVILHRSARRQAAGLGTAEPTPAPDDAPVASDGVALAA